MVKQHEDDEDYEDSWDPPPNDEAAVSSVLSEEMTDYDELED